MQGPSPVLAVPGGQASRWLVVLFEGPLAPAPVLLPRSPLVLPPATPGEELRPVAPVPAAPPVPVAPAAVALLVPLVLLELELALAPPLELPPLLPLPLLPLPPPP